MNLDCDSGGCALLPQWQIRRLEFTFPAGAAFRTPLYTLDFVCPGRTPIPFVFLPARPPLCFWFGSSKHVIVLQQMRVWNSTQHRVYSCQDNSRAAGTLEFDLHTPVNLLPSCWKGNVFDCVSDSHMVSTALIPRSLA